MTIQEIAAFAPDIENATARFFPDTEALYRQYHRWPELAFEEVETARSQAAQLRSLTALGADMEVTEGVGRTGVVGVLRNGAGPVICLRGDMDALRIEEANEVPWRSQIPGKGHLCGHSLHSACLIGVGKILTSLREQWRGTVVFCCQPAEEIGAGNLAMIRDGLFTRFPRPDHALALHVSPTLPSGSVGLTPGWSFSCAYSLIIKVKGRGGHAGMPQTTIDAVVLSAAIIMRLQTIVSRECSPADTAVVSVAGVQAGNDMFNVIPEEVVLRLSIRTYEDTVLQDILTSIERICRGEAIASGVPPELFPEIIYPTVFTPSLWNDPGLTRRIEASFQTVLGMEKVVPQPAMTFGEDFSRFWKDGGVPSLLFWLGAVAPDLFDADGQPKAPLPGLHAPDFLPDKDATLQTGLLAMATAALTLLDK